MSPDQSQKIFEAFHQVESTSSRRFGGTGIGLTLSLNLARLLGGSIIVAKSELGHGSTFIVTLNPQQFAPSQYQSSSLPEQQAELQTAKPAQSIDGLRILLVEDAEDVRIMVTYILLAQNAIVTGAINGLEGVRLALSQSFDLILMDVQMPVLNGYEATKLLRLQGCSLPIFAVTAHAMAGEREHCLVAGFTDYIAKPINIEKLVQVLGTHRKLSD